MYFLFTFEKNKTNKQEKKQEYVWACLFAHSYFSSA